MTSPIKSANDAFADGTRVCVVFQDGTVSDLECPRGTAADVAARLMQAAPPTERVTLRDLFAMSALTGLLAAETEHWNYMPDDDSPETGPLDAKWCRAAAESAYEMADAMLAARDREANP